MRRDKSGEYEITNVGGELVRAFIPTRLPPDPPLDLAGLQESIARAHLALGRLDGLSRLLPADGPFLYSYIRKEAVLSSQIEGTQSSIADLMRFEAADAPGVPVNDDVVEVSNYVRAMDHGLMRLRQDDFPLSNRLLREIHAQLLSRGRGSDKRPGEFRQSQVWIGGSRPGNAHFVPPPPHAVPDCMGSLEQFLHVTGDDIPPLIGPESATSSLRPSTLSWTATAASGGCSSPLCCSRPEFLPNRCSTSACFSSNTVRRTMRCWTECGAPAIGKRGLISFSKG